VRGQQQKFRAGLQNDETRGISLGLVKIAQLGIRSASNTFQIANHDIS
jgi:hypothetical protein